MKLTAIILLSACLVASAKGNTQNVTLSVKNASLEKVFKEIKKQTGFDFFYENRYLENTKRITLELKNSSLEHALEICFRDQPLTYVIVEKTIVVKQKQAAISSDNAGITNIALPIDITGKVTDNDGNPLTGASVKVKGTNNGTTTNNDGVFVLRNVNGNAVLEISYVGYETYTTPVNNKISIVASLKIKPENLNEVLINKGYYTEKQKYSVGNVVKVTSSDIEKQPVQNPLLALQGRVPGLFITQSTGLPGSAVTVRIQGIRNSLSNGSDPLYVIDGVPYVSQLPIGLSDIQGRSSGYGENGTSNPLNYMNPADIENIEILKDADATAIYGSRAANGAILITTKKGKAGQTKVDVNFQNGWGKVAHFVDLLNTQQYLEMRREAKANDGEPINSGDYDINGTWDSLRYTNWQKALIGGTAKYRDAHLSISGGNANTNFLIGSGYHYETTVFPGNLNDKKASVHFNVGHKSTDEKLQIQFSGNYLVDNNSLMYSDLTTTALQLAPNAPALYNSDGSLNWSPDGNGNSTWSNPLVTLNQKYLSQVHNLVSNAVFKYKIINGLEIRTSLGYTNLSRQEKFLSPLTAFAPDLWIYPLRRSSFNNENISSWILEPVLSYNRDFKNSNLDALIGGTILQRRTDQMTLDASGFTSDLLLQDIKSASDISVGSNIDAAYKYCALYTRINYNLFHRYIINLTGRRDGSSRFGEKNLFNNFWSIGGAWILSDERFMKSQSLVSFGKIRVSYGTTGNDQIGDYRFMNLFRSNNTPVPYQGVTSLTTSGFPNPYLQWEETRKLQAGADVGFIKDRILFTFNYYRNRSSNQLQGYQLPIITGATSVLLNYPATIQNSGYEILLNATSIQSKNFNWNTSLNVTIPRNKLLKYLNIEQSSAASTLVVGQPFTITKLYHSLGVDRATGLFIFQDSQGNITSNPVSKTDANVLVDVSPKLYGGFQNHLSYKNLSLDFLFQYVKQKGSDYSLGNRPGTFYSDAFGSSQGNQPVTVLNRWPGKSDNNSFQRFSSTYPSGISDAYDAVFRSDFGYSDISYIKLKNVSISWELKSVVFKKSFRNFRVYTQAQNLFTITKFVGLDPESSYLSLPPLRVWTVGVQATF